MAGWSDIINVGAIEPGYAYDIPFFNAYINAMLEKSTFLTFMSQTQQPIPYPDEPSERQGFVVTYSFLVSVINMYGFKANSNLWVKEERFDNPSGFLPLDDDNTGFWKTDDMEDLVGEFAWDVIKNPQANGRKMDDLLDNRVWNGMYLLYKNVFNYVEQDKLISTLITWEEWGIPDTGLVDVGTVCPLDTKDITCADAELEEMATHIESEAENLTLIASGIGRRKIFVDVSMDLRKSVTFRDFPQDYDPANNDYFTYKRVQWGSVMHKRYHDFKNIDDEVVKFEVAGQTLLSRNLIYDYITTSKSGNFTPIAETELAFDGNFPLKNFTNVVPSTNYEFDSSVIEDDKWVLTSYIASPSPHKGRGSDFTYDYDDIPVPQEVLKNGSATIFRSVRLDLSTGFDGNADLYYKTNVEGMVYNPPPEI